MTFKYFLDMVPEENVIGPISLTKFHRLRLQDFVLLDMLIGKTVEIAYEKKLIKKNTIIVDALLLTPPFSSIRGFFKKVMAHLNMVMKEIGVRYDFVIAINIRNIIFQFHMVIENLMGK